MLDWLWPSFIDPELPLTKGQRKAVHRAAWKIWAKNRRNIVLYVALVVLIMILYFFAGETIGDGIAWLVGAGGAVHKLCRALAAAVIFAGGFAFMGAVLQRWRFAPCVYEATRAIGLDVCGRCGYWLRDLGDDVAHCPECGAERDED